MAGSKINTYGSTNTTLTNIMTVLDDTRFGLCNNYLSSQASTAICPQIAAGSMVEVAGSLYYFSVAENIISTSASASNLICHIELIPSSSLCTAQLTTTTPVYRTDYSGWYLSTTSDHRILTNKIWVDAMGYCRIQSNNIKSICSLYGGTALTVASSSVTFFTGITPRIDSMEEWSTTNNRFTAKYPGLYDISYNGVIQGTAGTVNFFIYRSSVQINTTPIYGYGSTLGTVKQGFVCNTIVFLEIGSYVDFRYACSSSGTILSMGESKIIKID